MRTISDRIRRYGFAVLVLVLGMVIMAIPVVRGGHGTPLIVLFFLILLSAWYGGMGPGLLTTALIVLLTWSGPFPPWKIVRLVLFVAGGVSMSALTESLHAARRRIEESEQRLTAVLTSIGDAVIVTDAQGRVTFLNPVAETLTGWGSTEAVGKPLTGIFRIVAEDTHAAVEHPVDQVLREGLVVGLANHTILIARDGTERPIDDSGAPIREQGGTITGVVLVFRDVTQRRQAETLQARIAAIVESSDDAIIGNDLDGLITSWNAGAERIYGYTAEEIVGCSVSLLSPTHHRDEEPAMLEQIRQGKRIEQCESVRITKDGRPIDVALTISPIRDGYGRIVGASKIARDITLRKQTEEDLRYQLRLNRAITEKAGESIFLTDGQGRVLSLNQEAERVFGFTFEELDGTLLHDAIHHHYPDGRPFPWEECPSSRACVIGEAVRNHEDVFFRKDGSAVDAVCASMPLDLDGRRIGVVFILRDVTERKRSELALRRYAVRLENLRAIHLAIVSARSPAEISAAALQHLAQLVPYWTGGVAIFDFDREEIEFIATDGLLREWHPPGTRFYDEMKDRPEINALRQGQTSAVEDVRGTELASPWLEALRAAGMQSYVLFPLQEGGRLVGSLFLGSDRPAAFSTDQVDVAREVADHLAIAVRQALLLDEVRLAKGRLEALSRQLLRAQEEEQRRIARELHDEVGQSLTAIKIALNRIARDPSGPDAGFRLSDATAMTNLALEQVRDLSRLLRPSLLDDLGLAEALRALVENLAERTGLVAEVEVDEIEQVDPELETACYRIAQEALTNAIKHASATRLRVVLHRLGDDLELVVDDNGTGFDVAAATSRAVRGFSLGILGLQERATLAGGRAEITSRSGHGTRIRAVVPVGAGRVNDGHDPSRPGSR